MITHLLGGEVKPAVHGGEYGRMPIDIAAGSKLFSYLKTNTVNVWMSHGDEAVTLPAGFVSVAKSHQVRSFVAVLRGVGRGRAPWHRLVFRGACVHQQSSRR